MFSYFGYLGCGHAFEKKWYRERERKKKLQPVKQVDHITLLACALAGKKAGENEER